MSQGVSVEGLLKERGKVSRSSFADAPEFWPAGGKCPRLEGWLRHLLWLIEKEYDVVILFSGDTGKGKSSVMWWLFHCLDWGFRNGRMGLEGEQFMRSLLRRKRGEAAGLDEGRELADARRSMSLENLALNDFVEICRVKGVILGICKAFARDADRRIRDEFADFWVHVPERGVGVVSQPVRDRLSSWLKSGMVRMDESGGLRWRKEFAFLFPDPGPWPDWQQYKKRKIVHVDDWKPVERKR